MTSSAGASGAVATRLRRLGAEIDALGPEQVGEALDRELARRAQCFIAGLTAYRGHSFRRHRAQAPVIWRRGTARLLDYGQQAGAPAVLIVPSLINRFYVLDLLPERSFLRHLAGQGLRPLLLDWGTPGKTERGFGLDYYIARRLEAALAAAVAAAAGPVGVLGYCMGGLLALALALRRPDQVARLALLATPWDFHAEREREARLLASLADRLASFADAAGALSVPAIQSLFLALDPFLAERKFIRFAGLDPDGEAARSFVALEDWINDGVPLALRVAQECARAWYGANAPGRGEWRVAGREVKPQHLRIPALVVLPSRDRIVPPRSAEPLAAAIAGAAVLRPPLGHIGMMASASAPDALWTAIADWLRARLD